MKTTTLESLVEIALLNTAEATNAVILHQWSSGRDRERMIKRAIDLSKTLEQALKALGI